MVGNRKVRSMWMPMVIIATAAWIGTPTFSAMMTADELTTAVVNDEVNECFADGWSPQLDEGVCDLATAAAKPCRPCKDRPWCGCTYNGAHRVSCDPCCYQNYAGDIICFD